MKSYLPFTIKYSPILKLALIPFEKEPDEVYRGFELQYIKGEPHGEGYRVIAYRNDNFVDVYDDKSMHLLVDEKFNVTENGLHKHVQTEMKNIHMCNINNKQKISFEFVDIENRQIKVFIEEKSDKKTYSMNLLAPVGLGSKNPNFLPVFFMYNFDFIRKRKTIIKCEIAGKKIKIDKFPVAMNGQTRLYARYSNECELFEFANTDAIELKEIELNEEKSYMDSNVEYVFANENVLKKVIVHIEEQEIQICFEPCMNLNESGNGKFKIIPRKQMGYIKGSYTVQSGVLTKLKMIPDEGWISKPNTLLTKMILGKKSVFCNWSKNYKYESLINWDSKEIKSFWKNENI